MRNPCSKIFLDEITLLYPNADDPSWVLAQCLRAELQAHMPHARYSYKLRVRRIKDGMTDLAVHRRGMPPILHITVMEDKVRLCSPEPVFFTISDPASIPTVLELVKPLMV